MRTVLGIAVALAAVALVAAPAGGQAEAMNCADFASQADAQAFFDADPEDPNGLDEDGDGIACETTFGDPAPATTQAVPVTAQPVPAADAGAPTGGVDTGFGGLASEDDRTPLVPVAVGIVAATIAGAWIHHRRRFASPR